MSGALLPVPCNLCHRPLEQSPLRSDIAVCPRCDFVPPLGLF